MTARYFEQGQPGTLRAQQVWQILTAIAYDRKTITYGQLAERMGYPPGVVGPFMNNFLNPVALYCQSNNLPILPVLVVSEITGQPGGGIDQYVGRERIDGERERVFQTNWHLIVPPTSDHFAQVRQQ